MSDDYTTNKPNLSLRSIAVDGPSTIRNRNITGGPSDLAALQARESASVKLEFKPDAATVLKTVKRALSNAVETENMESAASFAQDLLNLIHSLKH